MFHVDHSECLGQDLAQVEAQWATVLDGRLRGAGFARTRAQRPGCGVLAEYAVGAIGALFQGKSGGRGPCWQTKVRGLERPAEICLSARRVRAHGRTARACDGARERHCRQDDGQGQREYVTRLGVPC